MPEELYQLLVVEDNKDTRTLVSYQLSSRFESVIVGSYDEALARASIETFDLFLLDINLGEENRTGIELLRALREMPHARHTPAIALTAYALPGDREHFLSAGFDAYLSKPFSRSELVETIQKVLSGGGS